MRPESRRQPSEVVDCKCETCAQQAGLPLGPTFTQAYRLACEARTVLAWPLDQRRAFLLEVEKCRGASGRALLEAALREEFGRRR